MQVAEYNKGRSMRDVDGSKRKIHGTKAYVRPDTIWADERYLNVTYEEIMEARKKLAEKEGKKDFKDIYKRPDYDWRFSV